jgi:hypothetical protein
MKVLTGNLPDTFGQPLKQRRRLLKQDKSRVPHSATISTIVMSHNIILNFYSVLSFIVVCYCFSRKQSPDLSAFRRFRIQQPKTANRIYLNFSNASTGGVFISVTFL